MEDNKNGGYSAEGRKLRPRKKVSFAGSERRNDYGHRTGNDENRSQDRGERRSYGPSDRNPYNRENRPYGERRSYGDGEHRAYNKPYGEGRSYGDGGKRPYGGGGRKPYAGQRPEGPKPAVRGKGRKKFDAQFDESADSGINRMIERRPNIDNARFSDNDYVPTPIQNEIRLNKFIANSGVCSRREADTFIQAGVVTVNGEVVTELGTKVNVLTDDVRFNGERLKGEEKVYIVMNKPKGYVTTSSDPHAGKTVMDLLKNCETRVFPVGRLDKATTGVLMFTNDGEIAERLTHPSYDKKKIYQVILDRELSQEDYDKVLAGVELSDGEVSADELEYIDATDHRRLGIEIHSGKNRIVRRIFESLGYSVKALDRVYFAGLTKKGLTKGEWRYLTEGEVNVLKMGAYV